MIRYLQGRSVFRLATNMGTYLILSDRYAEEIRNDERFSAYDALVDVCRSPSSFRYPIKHRIFDLPFPKN